MLAQRSMSTTYLENYKKRQEMVRENRWMNSLVRIEALKEMVPELQRYPFTELILFGSTATLTADDNSDIDLYAPGLSFSQMVQLMTEVELKFKTSVDILVENIPAHVLAEIHSTGLRLFPFAQVESHEKSVAL